MWQCGNAAVRQFLEARAAQCLNALCHYASRSVITAFPHCRIAALFERFHCFDDLRHYLKCITHNAVVGSFKEWRFGIFVDDHNALASVDAGKVLDGT
jgi:hypothetical protein